MFGYMQYFTEATKPPKAGPACAWREHFEEPKRPFEQDIRRTLRRVFSLRLPPI